MPRHISSRSVLLALLTATSLAGAATFDLVRPAPANAQVSGCSNTMCHLASACTYRHGYRCWFSDRRTCTTQECAFLNGL